MGTFQHILDRLSCALDSGKDDAPPLPSRSRFWVWHFEAPKLQDHLMRARARGWPRGIAHSERIDIADELSEEAASKRTRVEARNKPAQMLKPRKYEPKLDVTSNGQIVGFAELLEARRMWVVHQQGEAFKAG